jgi:hypothetical protein
VIERVGKLAYRLELPESMKIHPVISIAHLEPAPDPEKDPFKRPFSQKILGEPTPERLLRKRQMNRRGGGRVTEYLVRFAERPVEWDRRVLAQKVDQGLRDDYENRV